METVLPILQATLRDRGVDFCEPFQVSHYNQLSKRFPLPTFDHNEAFAVIVGSTKQFWPYFEKYIKSFPDDQVPKDPMDSFYQYTISDAIASHPVLSQLKHEIRYDWNTPRSGKFVHVQTAGHLAGFAFYDQEVWWSCHPKYGLWFVYRAVIIFDVEWSGPVPTPPLPVLDEETKSELKKWTEVANTEKWQVRATRLQIRDACPIGKDSYRYDGECMAFFFPITETQEDVIKRIRSRAGQVIQTPTRFKEVEESNNRCSIVQDDGKSESGQDLASQVEKNLSISTNSVVQ